VLLKRASGCMEEDQERQRVTSIKELAKSGKSVHSWFLKPSQNIVSASGYVLNESRNDPNKRYQSRLEGFSGWPWIHCNFSIPPAHLNVNTLLTTFSSMDQRSQNRKKKTIDMILSPNQPLYFPPCGGAYLSESSRAS